MEKEKSTFEKVLLMVVSCIIDNCDILFDVKKLPQIKIYMSSNKEDFE